MSSIGRVSGSSGSYGSYRTGAVNRASSSGPVNSVSRVGRVQGVSPVSGTQGAEGSSFADLLASKMAAESEPEEDHSAPRKYTYEKEELEDFQGRLYGFSSKRTSDIPVI